MRKLTLIAAAIFTLTAQPALADTYTAIVLDCHDGDTCTLLKDDHSIVKARMADEDAPEMRANFGYHRWPDQPYALESHALIERMVMGKRVLVEDLGADRYPPRRDCRIFLAVDGETVNINEEMVREGAAWAETPRYNHDPYTWALQAEARRRGLGLWGLPDPVPPWEWRHSTQP